MIDRAGGAVISGTSESRGTGGAHALERPNRLREVLIKQSAGRDWVNFTKGVAIAMVVYYHTVLFMGYLDLGTVSRAKVVLELFPIPAFFLIAGLFGGRMLTWSFPELWRRRLMPYLYLYVLWSIIRFGFSYLVPVVRGDTGVSARDPLTILELFVWPSSSYWFIYALAFVTFVAWAMRTVPMWLHLVLAFIVSALFASNIINTHNVGWNGTGEKYFLFVAGLYFSKQIVSRASKVRVWQVALLFGGLVVIGYILTFYRFWLPQLLGLPGALVAVALGIALSTYLVRLRPLGFVSYLGANSFPIYILHLFLVTLATVLIRPISEWGFLRANGSWFTLVLSIVILVATVYLSKLAVRVPWLFINPFPALVRKRKKSKARKAAVDSA